MTLDSEKPVGIICATNDEVRLLKLEFNHIEAENIANREFYQTEWQGVKIVFVLCHIGKVAAAMTTAVLIDRFDCQAVLILGLAGALDERLRPGDIVIGSDVIQHDFDASPLNPKFEIPMFEGPGISGGYVTLDKELAFWATCGAEKFLNEMLFQVFPSDVLLEFGISPSEPRKVYSGTVCTGDLFVSSEGKKNELRELNALCCEMEGAAVAQVCYEFKRPCCIVRIISDSASGNAFIDYNAFCGKVAAEITRSIAKSILVHFVQALKQ